MQKVEKEEKRPFGIRDKIGYMFGDFGNDFSFIFASSYLMVFYTKVLGIPGAAVGNLFLAARCVDAFTDVTMGRIVDTRRVGAGGRFRPFIKWVSVPVAVASTIMYLYFVKDWSYTAKLIYATVTYLLWGSFCYTAINIPYGSMASVISADGGERASLSTFRSIGASLASLVIGTVVPLLIYYTDEKGNQVVNPYRFTWVAVVFGVLSVVCYWICYKLCTERVAYEKKQEKQEGALSLLRNLGKNRPLVAIVCAALVLLLATLLSQAMNTYLFLDYFRNGKALAVVNFISVGGMLLLAPFSVKISEKIGKKEAGSLGMLLASLMYILLFFLRVRTIPMFLVLLFLGMLGMGYFTMITWAYITDVIDYQEVITGKREDGTVYAVYSFARKVGQALAGGIGGYALTAIGYVSEAPAQTQEVSERIYSVATLFPGVCYLVVFLIMQFFYPLNKREVEKNTRLLKERRE